MLRLSTLRKLAQGNAPEASSTPITYDRLLEAWANQDPDGSLGSLLASTGIGSASLLEALAAATPAEAAGRDSLRLLALTLDAGGAPAATSLFEVLLLRPTDPLLRSLCARGLDVARLRFALYAVRAPAGSLDLPAGDRSAEVSLLAYGRDLTAEAAGGAFDDLADRPLGLRRLADALLREHKANPLLLGEAGAGKTALVELFARSLARGEAPEPLRGARVFEVELGRLVAGTRYRGDFEKRLTDIISAAQATDGAILFMDEIHLLVGSGAADGVRTTGDQLLKPALARGLRVIGATTQAEYQAHIAPDRALERRFQPVVVRPASPALIEAMVAARAVRLAAFHGVAIAPEQVGQAVRWTDAHVPHRNQPDKAVDLLDSAAARARQAGAAVLSEALLREVLSEHTGKQVGELRSPQAQLGGLAQRLAARVLGQEVVVKRVAEAMTRRMLGIGRHGGVDLAVLFAGPTGVGKTELARAMAQELATMDALDAPLLRIDLGEHGGHGGVERLLGPPAGHRDSGQDAGLITAFLHRHARGLLLLDEAEKAGAEVLHLLLGFIETGFVRSGAGESLDGRQCQVVLTSNAVRSADQVKRSLGFAPSRPSRAVDDALARSFPPELLGRMDAVLCFEALGEATLRSILLLRIDEALARVRGKGLAVDLDPATLAEALLPDLVASRAGAREAARLVERAVLEPAARALLRGEERVAPGCADRSGRPGCGSA